MTEPDLVNTVESDFVSMVAKKVNQGLLSTSCMTPVEVINAVYSVLDKINDANPGKFSDYDVSVVSPNPEEELIREIHEEPPPSEFHMEITMRMQKSVEYICMKIDVDAL